MAEAIPTHSIAVGVAMSLWELAMSRELFVRAFRIYARKGGK